MTRIKQMHYLLGQMIKSAEKGNKKEAMELYKSYTGLARLVYHDPLTPLDREYDMCVQSLLVSVKFSNMESAISDAKERYSKISEPKH